LLARWASRFDLQPQTRKRPAWSGVMSDATGASNGVTSGAEARLHQNSLQQTRRQQTRLRPKNSS